MNEQDNKYKDKHLLKQVMFNQIHIILDMFNQILIIMDIINQLLIIQVMFNQVIIIMVTQPIHMDNQLE